MSVSLLFAGKKRQQLNDTIRQMEETLRQLEADNSFLRANGLAQATDLGNEIKGLQSALVDAEAAARVAQSESAAVRDEMQKRLAALESELEASRRDGEQQREQWQARLDELSQQGQTRAQKNHELTQKLAEALQAHDEIAHAATALRQATQDEHHRMSSQIDQAERESEILLLELLDAQTELEKMHAEAKADQGTLALLRKRWARLEARFPNYPDFETIRPAAVDTIADVPRVEWQITGLMQGEVSLPALSFSTFLKDGAPGIELTGLDPALSRQSAFALTLGGGAGSTALAQLRRLRSQQWHGILVAINALDFYFSGDEQQQHEPVQGFDVAFWRQALTPMINDIRALPAVFRFDEVTLKRELIHPDYEHLWLVFHNASHGRQRWPLFEVRLGAAYIGKDGFSEFPKLEFPLIKGKHKPFASWFRESSDDFGGKLELRFDLGKSVFDLGVWARLAPSDQALLLSLITALPLALKQMQAARLALGRPWSDWQGLSVKIIELLGGLLTRGKEAGRAPNTSASTGGRHARLHES